MNVLRSVACLVSGSIDSAMAVYLLKRRGFQVTAVYVNNSLLSREENAKQLGDAQGVADVLSIPFQAIHLHTEEWNLFKRTLLSEVQKGASPDTEVLFSKHILFKAAVDHISKHIGTDIVATGHYARNIAASEGMKILSPVDQYYDDSLTLAQVPQNYLRRIILPMGDFTKEVTRRIASGAGLGHLQSNAAFTLPDVVKNLFEKDFPVLKGEIVNLETAEIEGMHKGLHNFTIGEKVQLEGNQFYVSSKNVETSRLTVVPSEDHPALYYTTLFSTLANWVYQTPYNFYEKHTMPCEFRTHKSASPVRCVLTVGASNEYCGNDHIIVSSSKPIRAVSPGKFIGFYKDDECIGSATIMRPGPSVYAMNYKKYAKKTNKKETKKHWPSFKSIINKLNRTS